MNKRAVPPQWHKAFAAARVRLSFNALQQETGLGINTVIRFLTGEGEAEDETAERIAAALKISVLEALELRGEDVSGLFAMPLSARRLDATERQAVLDVVNAILRAKEHAHAVQADTTEAAPSGAPTEAGPAEKTDTSPDDAQVTAATEGLESTITAVTSDLHVENRDHGG